MEKVSKSTKIIGIVTLIVTIVSALIIVLSSFGGKTTTSDYQEPETTNSASPF